MTESDETPQQTDSSSLPNAANTASPLSPEVWYREGLRFTCTQCGNCCTGAPGFVWVDDAELQAIADFLKVSVAEIRLNHTQMFGARCSLTERANCDCTFLDETTRGCTIYPVRPKQCRTWPFWNSNLESRREWVKAGRNCPGMDAGRLYSLEEIQEQAAKIDI